MNFWNCVGELGLGDELMELGLGYELLELHGGLAAMGVESVGIWGVGGVFPFALSSRRLLSDASASVLGGCHPPMGQEYRGNAARPLPLVASEHL